MIKGKLVEAPWWPSGYESGLSLPWPEFNPGWELRSCKSHSAAKNEKEKWVYKTSTKLECSILQSTLLKNETASYRMR